MINKRLETIVVTYPQLPNHQTIPEVDEIQLTFRQLLDPAPEASLGPSFVADIARRAGWNGVVVQPQTTDIVDVVDDILQHNPTIVGFSALSLHVPGVRVLSEEIKSRNPSVTTVVGGYHATFRPSDFCEMESVDFVFRGTNLGRFQDFLKQYSPHGNKRDPQKKIINPNWTKNDRLDLDAISSRMPYDGRIFSDKWQSQNFGVYPPGYYGSIKESAGCPMECVFCEVPSYYGSKVLVKSADSVLEEIRQLYENGVKTIFFEGENFFGQWAERLVRELGDLDIGIHFAAETMAAALTPRFVEKLAKGRFVKIAVGVESPAGEDRVYLRKPGAQKHLDFYEPFRLLREHGILGWGFRMTGLPNYTLQDLKRNEGLSGEQPYDELRLTCFTPMPGTQVWEVWAHEERRLSPDWGLFDTTRLVYDHPHLTEKQIWESVMREYYNFITSPTYQIRRDQLIEKRSELEEGFRRYNKGVIERLEFLATKLGVCL
ncbi:radical SAM protein [Candidatus Woesearchaeota archaeon]|nr:radical SAM protein [Candidatus Woesearchaeota archaeon]